MLDQIDLAAFTFGEEEASIIAVGLTVLAARLAEEERNEERRAKKWRIVGKKVEVLRTLGIEVVGETAVVLTRFLRRKVEPWDEAKRNALLIELAFASPFAPYDVKVSGDRYEARLGELCEHLGLDAKRAAEVLEAIASARKAHRHIAWGKIAVGAVLGTVVAAAGGYLAAPMLAGYLGAAAGLTGAAAVSHGLALLGGGSLAAGGAGIAGGMALVTSVGAAVGGVGAGGATALWSAGYAAALSELVKLQVSYKEVLLRAHLREGVAARIIEDLAQQLEDVRARVGEETALNDSGAPRLEEFEKIEQGYVDTIAWLKKQEAAARAS